MCADPPPEPVFLCHEPSVRPPREGRIAPKPCNFDAKNIEVQSVLQSILRVFHQQHARGDFLELKTDGFSVQWIYENL